jgi:hypothetical protein
MLLLTDTPLLIIPRLRVAGAIASSAAYVSGHLAALVGKASYATALAIARSLPGHKGRAKPGEVSQVRQRPVYCWCTHPNGTHVTTCTHNNTHPTGTHAHTRAPSWCLPACY